LSSPNDVARFHVDQIDRLLNAAAPIVSEAWLASLDSAVRTMEHGLRARLAPRWAAAAVLRKTMTARQAEGMPSPRWHIACLIESISTLRLLALKTRNAGYMDVYRLAVTDTRRALEQAITHRLRSVASPPPRELSDEEDEFIAAERWKTRRYKYQTPTKH
jgi:hypothetical protein